MKTTGQITLEEIEQFLEEIQGIIPKESKIDFKDLSSKDPKVKYGFAKYLVTIARSEPAVLYPYFDFFVRLLDQKNKIFRWIALDIIGLLAKVDTEKKIDGFLNDLFGLLKAGNLITASHTINALANIAIAKPQYLNKVTKELLKVEHYDYETDECRSIAIGKVILALGPCFNQIEDKKAVVEFAKRQIENPRNATKKKAQQFLRKFKK